MSNLERNSVPEYIPCNHIGQMSISEIDRGCTTYRYAFRELDISVTGVALLEYVEEHFRSYKLVPHQGFVL